MASTNKPYATARSDDGGSSSNLIRLSLKKPMGIVFEPMYDPSPSRAGVQQGVRICDLPRTGRAAQSRKLQVGDELLQINDKPVSRSTFDEIMDIIIEAGEPINLLFRRPWIQTLQARQGVNEQLNVATNMYGPHSSSSSSTAAIPRSPSPQHTTSLSVADAPAVRQDEAEATIIRLQEVFNTSSTIKNNSDDTATLAKKDAVILELRSSVRQLETQMEKVQDEKADAEVKLRAALNRLRQLESNADHSTVHLHDARIEELQLQLDRVHAQILTADMVRKELEDKLEAEQYTLALRVADQERTIQQLEQDLVQRQSQWKETEEGLARKVQDLQDKLEKLQKEARQWKSLQEGSREDGESKSKIRGRFGDVSAFMFILFTLITYISIDQALSFLVMPYFTSEVMVIRYVIQFCYGIYVLIVAVKSRRQCVPERSRSGYDDCCTADYCSNNTACRIEKGH